MESENEFSNSSSVQSKSTAAEVSETGRYSSISHSDRVVSDESLPNLSHRSWTSSERAVSKTNKDEHEGLKSPSHASSHPTALNFSRHFTDGVSFLAEEDIYSDTFDSVDSLSETEDDGFQRSERASTTNSDSDASSQGTEEDQSDRSANSTQSDSHSQLSDSREDRDIFSSSSTHRSLSEEHEDHVESLSGKSSEELQVFSSDIESLSLSSSSVWTSSGSHFDRNASERFLEDKFTSADGEIVYYSDFSAEALTARQYTHRSENLSELSERSRKEKPEKYLEKFIRNKIQHLREQSLSGDAVELDTTQAPKKNDFTGWKAAESEDVKSFCFQKLHHLRQSEHVVEGACVTSGLQPKCYNRLDGSADVLTYGIPVSVFKRLQYNRMSMIDFHEPKTCGRCRQELHHMALSEFLKLKTAIAREQLTTFKVNNAKTSSMYGMKIVGDLFSEFSHLNQNPELVMKRLMESLTFGKSYNTVSAQPI